MSQPELRGGRWWQQDPSGEWRVWDEARGIWERTDAPPDAPPGPAPPRWPLVRLSTRRGWVVWLLAATLVVDLAMAASQAAGYALMERIAGYEEILGGGGDLPVEAASVIAEGEAQDRRDRTLAILTIVLLLSTAAAFITWLFGAYRNLGHLGVASYRFKPGWAIGSWFVPFLNLVRPKQIADDTWRGSDPEAPAAAEEGWYRRPVAPLLHWWWATWLLSGLVANVSFRLGVRAETLEQAKTSYLVGAIASLLQAVAAALAVGVVVAITKRQRRRAERLGLAV